MLRCAELLDAAVSAMMVGHQETLVRNHLSRASSSELDDCVLQGRIVDAVYLLGCKFASEVAHGLAVHFLDQRQQPHAFVRLHSCANYQERGNSAKNLFHI